MTTDSQDPVAAYHSIFQMKYHDDNNLFPTAHVLSETETIIKVAMDNHFARAESLLAESQLIGQQKQRFRKFIEDLKISRQIDELKHSAFTNKTSFDFILANINKMTHECNKEKSLHSLIATLMGSIIKKPVNKRQIEQRQVGLQKIHQLISLTVSSIQKDKGLNWLISQLIKENAQENLEKCFLLLDDFHFPVPRSLGLLEIVSTLESPGPTISTEQQGLFLIGMALVNQNKLSSVPGIIRKLSGDHLSQLQEAFTEAQANQTSIATSTLRQRGRATPTSSVSFIGTSPLERLLQEAETSTFNFF